MRRKRWNELSRRQQTIILGAVVVQELLSAATLLDLRRRPSAQIRGSKKLWSAADTAGRCARRHRPASAPRKTATSLQVVAQNPSDPDVQRVI